MSAMYRHEKMLTMGIHFTEILSMLTNKSLKFSATIVLSLVIV